MTRTFFTNLHRLDEAKTPVVVEYSASGGSPHHDHPGHICDGGGSGPEVEIVRAWLKADDNDPGAPDIEPTDAENEAWCEAIAAEHVDEPDDEDYL